jgi:hypothetical protein
MAGFVLSTENLLSWCQRQGLPCQHNAALGQLAIPYRVLDRDCPLLFIPRPDVHMLTLAMVLPFQVPDERVPAVREAISLLNDLTYMGAWVLSQDAGEIYFRLTLPVLDNEYSDPGLHLCARTIVSTVEAVASGLQRVADPKLAAPPQDAVPAIAR